MAENLDEKQKERQYLIQQAKKQHDKSGRNRIIAWFIFLAILIGIIATTIILIVDANNTRANENAVEGEQSTPSAEYIINDTGFAINAAGELVPADEISSYDTVVDIYQDYLCPHCADFNALFGADLNEYQQENPDDVLFVYHFLNFLDGTGTATYSTRAASAAITTLLNTPSAFHDFNDALYVNMPQSGNTILSTSEIADYSDPSIRELILGDMYADWVTETTQETLEAGEVSGTPSVFVNGDSIKGMWEEESNLIEVIDTYDPSGGMDIQDTNG